MCPDLKRMVSVSFFSFILLSSFVAFADDNSTKNTNAGTETFELDNVTIQAEKDDERFSAELYQYGHPVEVITGEEIEEAGFVDLARAVEVMVPGVFINSRQGRGGWTYSYLHGSDEILWLLDGVPINNPLYGSDWSTTLSINIIDRIEILKGGESVFYGTGARAGVINIITKSVTDETSGEFGAAYGEMDYREVSGHTTDTINKNGFMVFGSYEASDGYQVCDNQAYKDALYTDKKHEVRYDRSTVGGKYRREFDLKGKAVFKAQLRKQQGWFDYPYPQYRTAYNDYEEKIGIINWNHDINKHFSYYLKSYFHTWWGNVTFVDPDGSYSWGFENSNASVWGYEDYGTTITTSTRWGEGHEMIFGLDYRNYWGKEEVMSIPSTDRTHSYAAFASYRPYLFFSPATRLAFSGRYTTTNEDVDVTVWDFSVRTPIIGHTYFRGLVGTSFSLPTLMQLYGDNPSSDTYGNPKLDPEESLNIEAGVGGKWQFAYIDLGYFYQDVEDMILSVTLDNGDSSYKNADGTTQIDGFEIRTGTGVYKGFSLDASATWVNAENKETGKQLERVPEFYGNFNLGYRYLAGKYGADFTTKYIGDVYERGLAPFDDVNYGDYFTADASVFAKFGMQNRHKLTLRMENIFDEEYATRYNRASNDNDEDFLYQQYGLPRNIVLKYSFSI
ncbi:MAG: TonB-dependent receptor plug domain-containing protein [Thermodesulfobacteriota bacterium]